MFEASARQIEKKFEEITHVNLEHLSARDEICMGTTLALGAAAFAVADRFHVPQQLMARAAVKVAEVVNVPEVAAVAKELSSGEWLNTLPKQKSASYLSPQLQHSEVLAARLKAAFRQDGDVISNVERALNEHSAEFFPYVKPLRIKTADEDSAFMHTHMGDIYLHGKIERTASGEVELEYKSSQAEGESGLAAAFGHEYNHIEQSNFVPYTYESESITEGEYQRRVRLQESVMRNDRVELPMLTAENDYFALRAINFAGKKSMMEANALKPANFGPFYQKVMSFPADEIPPSFQAFIDRQNTLRSSIFPPPTDHDVGRQFFIVLRGQIATAQSRGLMAYKVYQDLYHETEAFQLEDAVKKAYTA